MKRVRNLSTLIAMVIAMAMLLAACGGGTSPKSDVESTKTESIKLKIGHASPEDSAFQVGLEAFKKQIEEKSNGTITVEIFPNGQLGSLRELVESVQMGNIDATVAASSYISNFCPEIAAFDLPFLLKDYDHVDKVLDGEAGKYLADQLPPKNLILLGWWELGFRNITTNKDHKINSVDDLKGLRIRVMANPIYQEMFQSLGCDPVPLDWSETFTALQQGTVDGQENSIASIYEGKIYEVNKYVAVTQHTYTPAGFIMSSKTWNKLSQEQQQIIIEAAANATKLQRQESRKREDEYIKVLKNNGMEFTYPDLTKFKEASEKVYEKHPELAQIVERVKAAR